MLSYTFVLFLISLSPISQVADATAAAFCMPCIQQAGTAACSVMQQHKLPMQVLGTGIAMVAANNKELKLCGQTMAAAVSHNGFGVARAVANYFNVPETSVLAAELAERASNGNQQAIEAAKALGYAADGKFDMAADIVAGLVGKADDFSRLKLSAIEKIGDAKQRFIDENPLNPLFIASNIASEFCDGGAFGRKRRRRGSASDSSLPSQHKKKSGSKQQLEMPKPDLENEAAAEACLTKTSFERMRKRASELVEASETAHGKKS